MDGIGDRGKILLKSGIMSYISLDLDNNGRFMDSYYGRMDSISTYRFEKLKQKDQFSGYSCTYYRVTKKDSYYDDFKMCVVEDNSSDVLSYINNNEKDAVRGFPVAVASGYSTYVLKSVTSNYSNYININFDDEMAKLKAQRERYDRYYPDDVADTVAVAAVPADEVEMPAYKSVYKNADENREALAINKLEEDNTYYWSNLPKYCTELDDKIPSFKDKELKKHAKNYAGRICDMYLFSTDEYMVDGKATLDQLRYEESYFRNTKFNKEDKKLLDEFLNNLD